MLVGCGEWLSQYAKNVIELAFVLWNPPRLLLKVKAVLRNWVDSSFSYFLRLVSLIIELDDFIEIIDSPRVVNWISV